MKFLRNLLFPVLLSFFLINCATVKYTEGPHKDNFSNLQSGRSYSFTTRDSNKKSNMIFLHMRGDEIVGYAGKKDSTEVILKKSDVISSRDHARSITTTVGIVIGVIALGALVIAAGR